MGLIRCTLRVDPGDEGFVTEQLDRLAAVTEPFRSRPEVMV